ncbi:hypothetical protein ACLOJK_023478 [Asimina triloba]
MSQLFDMIATSGTSLLCGVFFFRLLEVFEMEDMSFDQSDIGHSLAVSDHPYLSLEDAMVTTFAETLSGVSVTTPLSTKRPTGNGWMPRTTMVVIVSWGVLSVDLFRLQRLRLLRTASRSWGDPYWRSLIGTQRCLLPSSSCRLEYRLSSRYSAEREGTPYDKLLSLEFGRALLLSSNCTFGGLRFDGSIFANFRRIWFVEGANWDFGEVQCLSVQTFCHDPEMR